MCAKKYITLFFILITTTIASGQYKIKFTPAWVPQAQFVGYYVAEAKGFYRDARIVVEYNYPMITHPTGTKLLNGETDAAVLLLPQAVRMEAEGHDLVNILQTSQRSSFCFVAQPGVKLDSFESLRGKKVGLFKAGLDEIVYYINKKYNLNIDIIRFDSGISIYLHKLVDVIITMDYNELIQMKYSGVNLDECDILRFQNTEFDIPEDGLYVKRENYDKCPHVFKAFAEASRKGWEYAAEHPEEATEITMRHIQLHGYYTSKVIQRAMVNSVVQKLKDRKTNQATFTVNPEDVGS
ncbi:MAG: ABC transporter substrate-binding protein [Bacteroidia bacterium]|nr:ABC transporter substrate-binding protein [Bacteroidia bacterium]